MSRYDFPIPYGWYYVGEDATLAVGELRALRGFARDLILWRSEDGQAHLQDAYCPHLGAHIGKGGKVVGNTVECPFHRWAFDGEGKVAAIPYASKLNPYACLTTYPIRLVAGCIMAWYHPAGAAPLFDIPDFIPEIESGDFSGPLIEEHQLRSCLQEIAENTVDGAHFQTIHGHPGAASYEDISFEGHSMHMDSRQVFPSSRGPIEGTLSTRSWGMGMAVIRYQTVIEICMLTVNCPVEQELVQQLFRVYYKNPTGDPKIDRIGQAFSTEVNRQLRDDQIIWENKIYRDKPYLCDGDGPFMKFRQWAKQFYVEPKVVEAKLASAGRP